MFNNKSYELSLHRDYVSHWGFVEAVRELLQNSIDSASTFNYEWRVENDDTWTLSLVSELSTLSPQTLLLGSTGKAQDAGAIGSFGEGYKIALLVLTRLGCPVKIQNGKVDWKPCFRYNLQFEADVLVIEETAASKKQTGLTYSISGIDKQGREQVIASCLQMQSDVGEIKRTKYGDILIDQPHKLYVGGLFICKTELAYGYNVAPAHITLERDRQTVGGWELGMLTTNMWYETKEFDFIAALIDSGTADVKYAEYNSHEMVQQACYELFRKNNPGAIIAESNKHLKELVSQGMERVVFINSGMHAAVSASHQYRSEVRIVVKTPREILQAHYDKHKFNMHDRVRSALVVLIAQARDWKIK